ncbi:MAG: HAD family hydrolase [Traorella sp.]
MKKIAAFFDIDGTLYREGLITEVFKKFITYELVDQSKWHDEVKPSFMKYDRRQGEYDDYLNKMVDIYKSTLIGLSNEHILHIADMVIKQKGERVYTFTRDEINKHKSLNHLVIAVSGSPLELVEAMARKHRFDDCRGTIYVTDKYGKYTGEVIPMWDHKSKKKAILELCELYDIDLENSYAYGDTTGDFTMFELVGHPYAINPTRELIQKIKESEEVSKKITIIVERKNMIYKMNLENIDL